jgi:hypothetical protein
MPLKAFDLTQRPPRSPRVRLGGYVILPRMLDKCRAIIAGKNGEYNYACPIDQEFLEFAGVDPAALKVEVAAGNGDTAILEWVRQHQQHPRTPSEIAAWAAHQEQLAPTRPEGREFLNDEHKRLAPNRDDIMTWFDLLDLDDYASFGGSV